MCFYILEQLLRSTFFNILAHCYDLSMDYSTGKNVRKGYVETGSAEDCQLLCQTTNPCRFFTFDAENKRCWLKRTSEGKTKKENFISGQKYCDQKGNFAILISYSVCLNNQMRTWRCRLKYIWNLLF